MSLLEIRQKFIESSGRYDLVIDTTNWVDAGADWFIRAGQRYLDRSLETGNARARYFGSLLSGQTTMKIPMTRVIEKVYKITADGKTQIPEADTLRMREMFNANLSDGVPTAPSYYTPTSLRIASSSDLGNIRGDFANITYEDSEYSGIFFGVVADQDYGIEVEGLFYSPALTSDTSRSFWTEQNPEILVAAAFMSMERFYRNFEGAKESRASVQDMIQQLDFDYVAQEIVNITVLGG